MLDVGDGPVPGTVPLETLIQSWEASLTELCGRQIVAEDTSLEAVCPTLATTQPGLDPESTRREILDRLRIEMIRAVLDTEMLANQVDIATTSAHLRKQIEGDAPMSIAEYATLRHAIGWVED